MPSFTNTVFITFFYLLTVIVPIVLSKNKATDTEALFALKDAIADPFQALSSWNETTHVCSWNGIMCGHRLVDRVVSINLTSQSLEGTLSPYIGNLSFLESITLANNNFRGEIPQEIGHLRHLLYIELSNNSFSGAIPKNMSQCVQLHYLSLSNNDLVGTIFSELSSLVKLASLELSRNRLIGTIPPWIGNLTSLVRLSFYSCGLVGKIPESLGQLQNLRMLILRENSLTGNISPQLFNNSISVMLLGKNNLEGTIPSGDKFNLPNLRELDLDNNKFNGEILLSLSNASSSLEHIILDSNNFTGLVLNNFQRFTNLQFLILRNNSFTGDINFISSLKNCTNLKSFDVGWNLFKGALPNSISNLSMSLAFFSVQRNHIHGRVPPGIARLLGLKILILGFNYFSGVIPSSIGKLTNLQKLYLPFNAFSGHIPPSMGNLTWLDHLFLAYNNISGSIPLSFNNFKNLLILEISHNNLSGAIPQEVLSLSTISIIFNLSYNRLTGPLPLEVGHLKNLGILDLSNNRLSGPIPNTLSDCLSLERLHLEGNSFEGEIPSGLSALKALQDLDLSRNHLSGQIPSFLSELRLLNLNLSFNQLQGEVPTLGVFHNNSIVSIEGNMELCGGIQELGFPSCPRQNNSLKKELSNVLKIVLPIGEVVFVLVILLMVNFLYKSLYGRKILENHNTSIPSVNGHFMRLSYADLYRATSGFSHVNLIGIGRFGSIYKGILDDGKTIVAVKVLNLNVQGVSKTLIAECKALRGIRHRNIVKLLSVYLGMDFGNHDFKALVYEFKSNGSLDEWLHCNPNEQSEKRRHLTIIQRLNIAINVATALEYLHFGNEWTIIHGDIKPSNILLDNEMIAYVGDFGLAKVLSIMSKDFPANESSSYTVKGTIGYVAPEYGMGYAISTQGDAYSFGVLLLEMFTCIRPSNTEAFKSHPDLHSFVSCALPNHMMDILDPSLIFEIESNVDNNARDCIMSILCIGVSCSNKVLRDRMKMTNVTTQLTNLKRSMPCI